MSTPTKATATVATARRARTAMARVQQTKTAPTTRAPAAATPAPRSTKNKLVLPPVKPAAPPRGRGGSAAKRVQQIDATRDAASKPRVKVANPTGKDTIIRADGCYVPVHLIDKDKLKTHFDLEFYYNPRQCKDCDHLPVRPNFACEACDNFLGRYLLWREANGGKHIRLPRDAFWRLDTYFGIDTAQCRISDQRAAPDMPHGDLLKFRFDALRDEQKTTLTKLFKWVDYGLRGCLKAAPRTGKTIMSLGAIFKLKHRAVVIATQEDLLLNFRLDAEKMSNLLEVEQTVGYKLIDFPRDAEHAAKLAVVLLTPQRCYSDQGWEFLNAIRNLFGVLVFDELHRLGGEAVSATVDQFNVLHAFGVTATYIRKDGKHAVIKEVIGPVVATANADSMVPKVITHYLPDSKPDGGGAYYNYQKSLQNDKPRTTFICKLAESLVREHKHVVMLPVLYSNHVGQLYKLLTKRGLRVGVFVGTKHPLLAGADLNRERVVEDAKAFKYDVIIGIRSILGTGINIPAFSALLMICPTGHEHNMYQETKRVCTPYDGKPQPELHYVVENCARSKKYLGHIDVEVFRKFGYLVDDDTREFIDKCRVEGMNARYNDESEAGELAADGLSILGGLRTDRPMTQAAKDRYTTQTPRVHPDQLENYSY